MKEITYIGEIGGGNHPMIVTLPINADTDIKKGTPIFYNNHAASTSDSADGTLIGILAEDYYCEENELIPGSGSGEIKVIVSNNAVYECDALVFEATGDYNETLMWNLSTIPDEDSMASTIGSKLVLVGTIESSLNKDSIGTIYEVTSCENQGSPSFFLDCGISASSQGDLFAYLPPYGYNYLSLTANGELKLNVNAKGNIKIVGTDKNHNKIRFIITDII